VQWLAHLLRIQEVYRNAGYADIFYLLFQLHPKPSNDQVSYNWPRLIQIVLLIHHSQSCCHSTLYTYYRQRCLGQWYSTRHLRGYADYTICITCIKYQQLWGYKVEAKLYLGVGEQKRLNTTGIEETGEFQSYKLLNLERWWNFVHQLHWIWERPE
jgi:hypothetical protein